MRVYFDSSAFAKRYVVEAGTAEVLAWCDRATELASSGIADAVICDTTPQVVQKVIAALEAHPLRAMDGIHIGAAHVCAAEAFISADVQQCAAARLLGLQVVAL